MVTCTMCGTPTDVFFIGLSEGNLRKLREGKPMLIAPDRSGLPVPVCIHYGETDEAIRQELVGMFPDTQEEGK